MTIRSSIMAPFNLVHIALRWEYFGIRKDEIHWELFMEIKVGKANKEIA